ncbi:MAG: NACHT domain-containing protein [Halieaceae bacterium]
MPESMKLHASRAGDQFHYLWAARRALMLLQPTSDLVAIAIEGVSGSEDSEAVEEGEESIDVAEYFGSQEIEQASLIRYMQLKHSTLHASESFGPGNMKKTISDFALRFIALKRKFSSFDLKEKVEFWIVTNRPISVSFSRTVAEIAGGSAATSTANEAKLKSYTGLDGKHLQEFCQTLKFEGGQDGYWEQRNILRQDLSSYLAGADFDAPTRLKELISSRALPENIDTPEITKVDVLRALQTTELDLRPAENRIERVENYLVRESDVEVVQAIVESTDRRAIVTADAGVGKSVFSINLEKLLPSGSIAVVYDCFGNGQYRCPSGYRHRHRDALTQVANELSALGLCHPLIPSPMADITSFLRAFLNRLAQAVSVMRAKQADALLVVILDAADNAQLAAEEIGEARSFIRDLLRESVPTGVRLVATCRPHRVAKIDPPPTTAILQLDAFSREESAAHLRLCYPEATETDVDEFHRLSSSNPRVQALALSQRAILSEMLRLLGPNPKSVESTLDELMTSLLANLKDSVGSTEAAQIDLLCAGMACLRPLIPISVLSAMSGIEEGAIRSFALDLGRPLLLTGDYVQFYDEPAETWFRERYRPNRDETSEFVHRLLPLSSTDAYVAAVVPQLLLEAGQLSELVDLALNSKELPEDNPIQRRDIELQRLQFALKAALQAGRFADASKLALKAGGESAGDDRQRSILQENTDLVAFFLDSDRLTELVSRATFDSSWMGSHHVYEASLLAGSEDLIGEARGRLRMAEEWLSNWSRLSDDDRAQEPVSDLDRANFALAHLQIHDCSSSARSLRVWSPREVSYSSGLLVARRLLDHGNSEDLLSLLLEAGNDLGLVLAIAQVAREKHVEVPRGRLDRALKLVCSSRVKIQKPSLAAILALVECVLLQDRGDDALRSSREIIDRYLPSMPPFGLFAYHDDEQVAYLRLASLRAALDGRTLSLIDVASKDLRAELEDTEKAGESRVLREFKQATGMLLPWYGLWAATITGVLGREYIESAIEDVRQESGKNESYHLRDSRRHSNEISSLWVDALFNVGDVSQMDIEGVLDWAETPDRRFFTPTLNRLSSLCGAVPGLQELSFRCAEAASFLLKEERTDALLVSEGFVEIARSLVSVSPSEAEAYFEEAVRIAGNIGEENLSRWNALIYVAEAAANSEIARPELAYNFSRCAEVTRSYIERDKHFPWYATVSVLVDLCPNSSFSIMSRWRDREFGQTHRFLPPAVQKLISREKLSPLDAVSLVPFGEHIDEIEILEHLVSSTADTRLAKLAVERTYRYMRLDGAAHKQWSRMSRIAESLNIELPLLQQQIALEQAADASREHRFGTSGVNTEEPVDDSRLNDVFDKCDLHNPHDISSAYVAFRSREAPIDDREFFREACRRVDSGTESEFIRALSDAHDFNLYCLRSFIEVYPDNWVGRLSARKASTELLLTLCRRHCSEISRNSYFEVFPFSAATNISGVTEAALVGAALEGLVESSVLPDSRQLFDVVGMLCIRLDSEQAAEVLQYGLDLFDAVLDDSDGDGVWSPSLAPPGNIHSSLAGYIWAGLGSPIAAVRWRSAHAVVFLFSLEREAAIQSLLEIVEQNLARPFVDSRFDFYWLHARLWLLIAIGRASLLHPISVAPYVGYVKELLKQHESHALMRAYAANILLNLSNAGAIELSDEEIAAYRAVNVSTLGTTQEREKCVAAILATSGEVGSQDAENEDRLFFGIDLGPYWLAPLGRRFGLSESEIAREALLVLRDDLGFKADKFWESDERANCNIYYYEDTRHDHGSTPKVDDLAFYLTYHTLFVTAGKLLDRVPLFKEDWEQGDPFNDWLSEHDLAREDGRWLADRRDPVPVFDRDWPESTNFGQWIYSIELRDFYRVLHPARDSVVVWGGWTESDSSVEEMISISSALVSPDRSSHLLRALQTASDPHNFRIPDEDDDLQIDEGSYILKGWICNSSRNYGGDVLDPWCGGVRFPAPQPALAVVDSLALRCDEDLRHWSTEEHSGVTFESQVWGSLPERHEGRPNFGSRLIASETAILQYLNEVQMDLIVEVQVQRGRRSSYYDGGYDDLGLPRPSAFILLIKRDGSRQKI